MSHTNLFDGFIDLALFAADAGRHPRTVRRWLNQPDGLPFTRIGNRILIHVPSARMAHAAHETASTTPEAPSRRNR
jgi:hypothetical protein